MKESGIISGSFEFGGKDNMRKREFQRAAVFAIIPVIVEYTKEEGKRLTLSVTSKFYDTFINHRFSGGMLQINLYQKGEITYKVWDCIGICRKEYVKDYVYNENDNHEQILAKFVEDFSRFLKDVYSMGDVHDFSDMFDFTVGGDPNNSLGKYEKFIRVMRGEETGDEEA